MTGPALVVESGHFINVTDIAFGPSPIMVSASADETLRLWDLDLACEAGIFRGHRGPVYCARLDRAGKLLASGGWDQEVRLWDAASQTTLRVLASALSSPVDALALSDDGTVVAATGLSARDRRIVVWDTATGAVVHVVDMGDGALFGAAVALDAAGHRLAYTDADARLHVVDLASGADAYTFDVPPPAEPADPDTSGPQSVPPAISDVTVLTDGRVVAACWDGVRLFDESGNPQLLATDPPHRSLQLADGTLALFGDHTEFWDVTAATPTMLRTVPVAARACSRDGALLAAPDGRHIALYDAVTAARVRRLGSMLAVPQQAGNLARQFVLATSATEPTIVHAAPDGYVRVWDLARSVAPRSFRAHDATIHAVAVSPDGKLVATGADEVRVWKAGSPEPVWSRPVEDWVKSLAFSAEGSAIITGGWSGSVTAFDTSTAEPIASEPIDRTVEGIGASPWNDVIAVGTDRFRMWDPFLATVAVDIDVGPAQHLAVSRTGTMAVPVGPSKWLDPAGRQPGGIGLIDRHGNARPLTGHRTTPRTVAFSHDGSRLASGGDDGEVIVWDVDTATLVARADAHAGDVTGLGYLHDDRFLASIGLDGAVRIWDGELHLVATLVSLDDDDYVAVTDANHYSATRHGLRAVKLRIDGRLAPFEEFDVEANRPDLVLARFGYAPEPVLTLYRDLHARRMRRLGLDTVPTSPAGELDVSGLPGPVVHDAASTLRITSDAGSDGSPHRLMIAVNDVLVDGCTGREMPGGGALDVAVDWAQGDNEIHIWSVDPAGTRSARTVRRVFRAGAETKPNLTVLAIGVSHYEDERLTLRYAAKDARDLTAELGLATRHFANVETHVLEDATSAQIEQASAMLRDGEVGDHVVVFLAGHGALWSDDFYFLPSDFDRDDLAGTALSFHELERFFDGIPARRRLLLLDACHAGEVEEAGAGGGTGEAIPMAAGVSEVWNRREVEIATIAAEPPTTGSATTTIRLHDLFADLREGAGAYVLAAAGANEYAFEGGGLHNGVFTASILRALRDRPADGLRVSALARTVSADVAAMTGGRQRPVTRRENLLDDFVVA